MVVVTVAVGNMYSSDSKEVKEMIKTAARSILAREIIKIIVDKGFDSADFDIGMANVSRNSNSHKADFRIDYLPEDYYYFNAELIITYNEDPRVTGIIVSPGKYLPIYYIYDGEKTLNFMMSEFSNWLDRLIEQLDEIDPHMRAYNNARIIIDQIIDNVSYNKEQLNEKFTRDEAEELKQWLNELKERMDAMSNENGELRSKMESIADEIDKLKKSVSSSKRSSFFKMFGNKMAEWGMNPDNWIKMIDTVNNVKRIQGPSD
jgi:signal transduction histidine kinase